MKKKYLIEYYKVCIDTNKKKLKSKFVYAFDKKNAIGIFRLNYDYKIRKVKVLSK